MEIGDMVYVEPSYDHVGGYGKLICILNDEKCLVEFKHVLTEEVRLDEIQVIC